MKYTTAKSMQKNLSLIIRIEDNNVKTKSNLKIKIRKIEK